MIEDRAKQELITFATWFGPTFMLAIVFLVFFTGAGGAMIDLGRVENFETVPSAARRDADDRPKSLEVRQTTNDSVALDSNAIEAEVKPSSY